MLPNGQKVTVCPYYFHVPNLTSPFADYQAQYGYCWSSQDLTANGGPVQLPPGHVGGYLDVVFPMLVAAIDPVAEQQLVGLGNAVKSGRYLRPPTAPSPIGSQPIVGSLAPELQVPVLATTDPFVDDTDQITVNRLPASAVGLLHQGLLPDQLAAALAKETSMPVETGHAHGAAGIPANPADPSNSSYRSGRVLDQRTHLVPTAVRWGAGAPSGDQSQQRVDFGRGRPASKQPRSTQVTWGFGNSTKNSGRIRVAAVDSAHCRRIRSKYVARVQRALTGPAGNLLSAPGHRCRRSEPKGIGQPAATPEREYGRLPSAAAADPDNAQLIAGIRAGFPNCQRDGTDQCRPCTGRWAAWQRPPAAGTDRPSRGCDTSSDGAGR